MSKPKFGETYYRVPKPTEEEILQGAEPTYFSEFGISIDAIKSMGASKTWKVVKMFREARDELYPKLTKGKKETSTYRTRFDEIENFLRCEVPYWIYNSFQELFETEFVPYYHPDEPYTCYITTAEPKWMHNARY